MLAEAHGGGGGGCERPSVPASGGSSMEAAKMRDGPRLQRLHLTLFASVTVKSTARDHDRGGAHSPKRRCVGRARDRDIDAQVGEANITYGLPMQHSPMANSFTRSRREGAPAPRRPRPPPPPHCHQCLGHALARPAAVAECFFFVFAAVFELSVAFVLHVFGPRRPGPGKMRKEGAPKS